MARRHQRGSRGPPSPAPGCRPSVYPFDVRMVFPSAPGRFSPAIAWRVRARLAGRRPASGHVAPVALCAWGAQRTPAGHTRLQSRGSVRLEPTSRTAWCSFWPEKRAPLIHLCRGRVKPRMKVADLGPQRAHARHELWAWSGVFEEGAGRWRAGDEGRRAGTSVLVPRRCHHE